MDTTTINLARKHFSVKDYKLLNPDLQFNDLSSYETHFYQYGILEGRLINRKVLNIYTEFGRELILIIPFLYSLQKRGLLFNNTIQTFKGMKPYYYFLPDEQFQEIKGKRSGKHVRYLYYNNDDSIHYFNLKYWTPPPYKKIFYTPNTFEYSKPLCIVQNKYNFEWENLPENYIDLKTLDSLFSLLSNKYQLVYIRPNAIIDKEYGYSEDQNVDVDFDESAILKKHPSVIQWNTLQKQHSQWNYNELKLRLFSSCVNYISVLGGNNYLNLFFAKKLLILRRKTGNSGLYSGWYKQVAPELNVQLKVVNNWKSLIIHSQKMFVDAEDVLPPSGS